MRGVAQAEIMGPVGLMNPHELIKADQVSVHDRILVATSGHSGGSPDSPVEVLRVLRKAQPVLWIRTLDGRTSVYVPGRLVHRITSSVE
jgi:hypothetical protein